MKKVIIVAIFILLIGIMSISSYFLYKNYKEERKQEKVFEELINISEDKINKTNIEEEININKLYSINNDIIGWLKIDNTNIDYPIMQTKKNPNYYLRRNFYKQYSYYGTPYLAENCDIETSDNLIIYGHHINNYKMFGELEKYKNKEFYEEHKNIKLYTLEEKQEYEIIAVFKTIAYSITGFKYYNYINFSEEREFNSFYEKCKELSFYNVDSLGKYGDKLITLSTCEYSKENGRLVVLAKKK